MRDEEKPVPFTQEGEEILPKAKKWIKDIDVIIKKIEEKINQKIDQATDSTTIDKIIDKILELI